MVLVIGCPRVTTVEPVTPAILRTQDFGIVPGE